MHIKTALLLALLLPSAWGAEFPPNGLLACSDDAGGALRFSPEINHIWMLGGVPEPRGLAFGPDGRLYIVSGKDERIYAQQVDGTVTAVTPASSPIVAPKGLAIGPHGHFFVGKPSLDQILEFDTSGNFVRSIGAGTTVSQPVDLAFGPDGHLFVASTGAGGAVQEIDPSGNQVREIGANSSLNGAGGIVVGTDGRLYVSSPGSQAVVVFDAQGNELQTLGGGQGLNAPSGLSFGPNGHLFVISEGDGKIIELDASGNLVRSISVGFGINSDLDFAPFRFSMKLKGTLSRNGFKPSKHAEKGVLSLRPGLPTIMFQLESSGKSQALSSVFGATEMLLQGYQALDQAKKKKRRFQGSWDDGQTGVASLVMAISGKIDKIGNYVVKSAKGNFVQAGEGGIFSGSLKTGKKKK